MGEWITMGKLKRTLLLGITDSLFRGLLLFLLGEYIVSDLGGRSYVGSIIAAAICMVLSVVMFIVLAAKAKGRLIQFYGMGQVFFLLALLILLMNYLEVHIYLFPHRELASGDGIILLLSHTIFILPSEVIRLVVFISMIVNKRVQNNS